MNTPIHRGQASARSVAKALRTASARSRLTASHPLYDRFIEAGVKIPTLPMRVEARRAADRLDTPENRFVKHALKDFLAALMQIEQRLIANGSQADLRLLQQVMPLKRRLAEYLDSDLMSQVSAATLLPLGSPVLQRRGGYRELLQAWVKFNLAVKLSWSGAQDIFGAGKKNVALLYEYWLFFVLLDVVTNELAMRPSSIAQLLQPTSNGFDLRLKSGLSQSMFGTYESDGRKVKARFSYNRTFAGVRTNSGTTYPESGSWTRAMRPDYTLSIWPDGMTENEAELQEFIVHIHFDAKYRVETLLGLFGAESNPDGDDQPGDSRIEGKPVRSDLLKMHAYRDAIRRTEGAYVLYPGPPSGDHVWTEFHEIIPGLGAFSVRPGFESSAKESLRRFIRDVLENTANTYSRSWRMRAALRKIQDVAP